MKTLAEIDAILRDAQSKARVAHKAETLDAARQHAAGAGTLIRKARVALAEVSAAREAGRRRGPAGGAGRRVVNGN